MSTKLKYLVSNDNLEELAHDVNIAIEDGWRPFGSVVAIQAIRHSLNLPPSVHMKYIQPMILRDKSEKHNPPIHHLQESVDQLLGRLSHYGQKRPKAPPPPDQEVIPITPLQADGL